MTLEKERLMSKKIRLSEYLNKLNESEVKNSNNPSQQKIELTSPHSAMSDEELRVFLPYMHGRNAFLVTEKIPERKKNLMLRTFLRSKRNQYVEIKQKSRNNAQAPQKYSGKVTAVGRDFMMLTTVRKKRWLPYSHIESANVLSGFPDYTNSYSQVYYDNDLKKKLRTQFATTVASKDELIQQFYEETLFTNLNKWRGITVLIATFQDDDVIYGKLSSISENSLTITALRFKNEIPLSSIVMMETVSPMKTLFYVIKNIRNWRSINS
jgi:hypothetical protein